MAASANGKVSVEWKAIETIDSAVGVGSGGRSRNKLLDEASLHGVITCPISTATLIESRFGSRLQGSSNL